MSTKSLKMLFKPFILPFYFIGEIEEKRPGGGGKKDGKPNGSSVGPSMS